MCVEVHPLGRDQVMTITRVNDKASITMFNGHSDAHDTVLLAKFPRNMRNDVILKQLGSGIFLRSSSSLILTFRSLLGP